MKRYVQEIGTDARNLKMQRALRADVPVLASLLTYAEIHATLARRLREQLLRVAEYHAATTRFDSAWRTYPSAQWAAYAVQTGTTTRPTGEVVFATSDKQLAEAAKAEMFETLNPQMHQLP